MYELSTDVNCLAKNLPFISRNDSFCYSLYVANKI